MEAGVLSDDDRLELIDGILLDATPAAETRCSFRTALAHPISCSSRASATANG